MATTFVDYTGDGNATKSFSFPSIKEADIKVDVDGVIKTSGNHYNITSYTTTGGGNVVFTSGNIPSSPAAIRIFRDTDVDSAKATFTAGSSVKAGDLNNNNKQLLYAAQEEQNQTILTSDIKDGAITTAKIAADAVTNAKMATNSVGTDEIINNAVTQSKIAANSVQGTIIANSAITTAKIADSNVTTAKIADNAVTMAKLNSGTLPTDITVASANIVDGTIATADIGNLQVTSAKIAADAIDGSKIGDNTIDSEHYVAGSIDTQHIADSQITTAKIADSNITTAKIAANAVTTAKIADGELKTLAGMQSGTASKLADSTALTADIADLNQIDGMAKQTTISDDDTKFPTSGAVVDYVAAQLEPFGGFEAIANDQSFPNTQPASGVAISIADAAGIVVSGSNSSTTGRTLNGTTVTINNINSQFTSSTVASGIRFIVTSTGSGHVYNYHKATLPESDLVSLSGDINDFNERYRVGSSNPSSSLDGGDLFFNTTTGKLLVYNASTSAWEETQSIGNFFINTLSSSSGTGGGSATFNGSAYRFTLSNAGQFAQQHLVSINGVIQKPNSGTSQPSEGFAIDSSDIIFSAAPANGADFFIVTIGSAVSIGTPSNNTVTNAILQNGSVSTAKIQDDAVDATKLANSINAEIAANTAKVTNATHTGDVTGSTVLTIANDVVGPDELADTSVSAGSYGSATAIPAITVDAQGRITAASTNAINTSTIPVADESSDTTCFPVFVTAATGDQAPKTGSNLTFNSATGALGATSYTGDGSNLTGVASAVADGCIYENSQTISNNYTISTNKNALSAGPITIANGVTLTIPSGSTYTIV